MSTNPKNLEFTQVEIHQVVIKKKMLAEVEDVTSDELFQWLDQGTTNDSDLDEQCEEIVDEAEMLDELVAPVRARSGLHIVNLVARIESVR